MAKQLALDPRHCDYIKKDGLQCKRLAGWGTDHSVGRCKTHGGNSPSHRKSAARLTIASMATEADADPYEELLKTIRLSWGAVTFLREKLEQFKAKDEDLTEMVETGTMKWSVKQTEYGMWMQIYGEWADRAAKHAKLALDAGIAERSVRTAESQGELLATAIRAILDGLGLTKDQQERAPQLVRSALLALEAN